MMDNSAATSGPHTPAPDPQTLQAGSASTGIRKPQLERTMVTTLQTPNLSAPAEDSPPDARVAALVATVRARLAAAPHIPSATYRVQLNRYFTFEQAREQVEYLRRLGISDLYASPYFAANAGSLHGYDIVNHNELNPEIGSQDDYDALVAELHRAGMYQVLDIVPNHMGIGQLGNTWWLDVLENGPASVYAPYFDIEWDPINTKITNKVLLPILGDQYGKVLENQELRLSFLPEDGAFRLHYYDRTFPIEPGSYQAILDYDKAALIEELGAESEAALEYQSILTALQHLPPPDEADRDRVLERNREKEIIKRRLASLCAAEPRVPAHVERSVSAFNGMAGEPRSFDLLDRLLDAQPYRLSFWRIAGEEINYRRFFDINELAAIQVDQLPVFEETHRTILQLLAAGKANGLRIDHIDGLLDPAGYLENVQRGYVLAVCRACMDELAEPIPDAERPALEAAVLERFAGPDAFFQPLYTLVEKILGRGESLPADWATYGTTGYEFTNAVNGLFVNRANAKAFDALYTTFTDETVKFADLAYESKKQIMRLSLSSEINMLTNMLNRISQSDRRYRDFTLNSIRHAIREVIACFPVYRTYITARRPVPDKRDQSFVETAVARAKQRNPATDLTIFDFLRDILVLKDYAGLSDADQMAHMKFVLKFQQVTGPVIAKGLEDTAFYVYNRLISLNEVGGEPGYFGLSPADFHKQQSDRQRRWPAALLTTSTHDTKRSEDVRARIDVLSERPKEWRTAVRRWARANRKYKRSVDGQLAPSPNEEYFLYQTLLGVWPCEAGLDDAAYEDLLSRVDAYMRKALNEAKVHSSWVNTNEPYVAAVSDFIRAILRRDEDNRFLPDFLAFQQEITHYGAFNSLAQVLLKITSPGVPDIYQGTELWDFSLVDPDNRRPVDYGLRRRLLDEVAAVTDPAGAAALMEARADGRIKLFVTSRALTYRRDHADLFQAGAYTPLVAQGRHAECSVAFARSAGDRQVITVVPVLAAGLAKSGERITPVGAVWSDTWLEVPGATAGQAFRNLFTGEVVEAEERNGKAGLALEQVLAVFPVALLERI
jgi:(1->4)-alpha-D-glucan 1-alpha-D-glucosylmutase